MQVVILAGGLATRLGAMTGGLAKSMVDIGGKPFLERQLDLLKAHSVSEVILCVGEFANQIQDYFGDGSKLGLPLKYSHDGGQLLGTGGALKKAQGFLDEAFLVMYGDGYLTIDYSSVWEYFLRIDPPAMMVVHKNLGRYDQSNVAVRERHVVVYEQEPSGKMRYLDYGLSVLKRDVLELIPQDTFFHLGALYARLAQKGEMLAYEITQRPYEIGSPEGLNEVRNLFASKRVSLTSS